MKETNYLKIPFSLILELKELSFSEIALIAYIGSFKDYQTTASNFLLSGLLCVNDKTIRNYIAKLKKLGYIEKNISSIYRSLKLTDKLEKYFKKNNNTLTAQETYELELEKVRERERLKELN